MTEHVSVIIPTHNRLKTLNRAVNSVLTQDYQNFSLIIVDDASTQRVRNALKILLKKWKTNFPHANIFLLCDDNSHVTNPTGPSATRNRGLKFAQEQIKKYGVQTDRNLHFISFLDSDDAWLPYKLSKQIRYLQQHPSCLYVHCHEEWYHDETVVKQKVRHRKQGGFFLKRALEQCLISPSAVMMRASFFDKIGLWNEDLPFAEDYEIWLRAQLKYPAGYIAEPLCVKYAGAKNQLTQTWHSHDLFRLQALVNIINDTMMTAKQYMLFQQAALKFIKRMDLGWQKYDKMLPEEWLIKWKRLKTTLS